MYRNRSTARRGDDAGLTIVEILISVLLLGIITTAVSSALIVTLRTTRSTDGRLNVARAEQNVATWLPADLSSAVDASPVAGDSPCGVPLCPGITGLAGSNALMLSWPNPAGGGDIKVSYVYRQAGDGVSFELVRVKCTSPASCIGNIVLRDLEGPSPFTPGVTDVPADVISVTVPLVAGATENTCLTPLTPHLCANYDSGSTARRIVVTINGGGATAGGGGGVNRVSITAGGTSLGTLEAAKVTGPSFTQARSRCGGPITIIVDDSGSIGSDVTKVENAVRGFVKALSGTPTSVQVVKFTHFSSVLGPPDGSHPNGTNPWNHYFDMTDANAVYRLIGDETVTTSETNIDKLGLIRKQLDSSGGTNWEDAIYRTFYAPNGDRLDNDGTPVTFLPNLVVFFTDGEPTFNRVSNTLSATTYPRRGGSDAQPIINAPSPMVPALVDYSHWAKANGNTFDQEGYNRAEYLLSNFRNTDEVRLIGVGVGGISSGQVYSYNGTTAQSFAYGMFYSGGTTYSYKSSSSSTSSSNRTNLGTNTDKEKVLGNFIAGGALWISGDKPYVKSEYVGSAWTNPETADMFITNDFTKLPSALTTIALGQCGGTLTMQTSLGGSPAPANVTYESGGETVTTSLVNRAAAFDLTTPGGAPVTAVVKPQSFALSGYVAQSWSCKTKGADIPLSAGVWSYVTAGDASAGINVTVSANEAVGCTLAVATS